MAVLVCLPCTTKRAFKQALGIPVAVMASEDKANQSLHCAVITAATGKLTASGEQQLQEGGHGIDCKIPALPAPHFISFTRLPSAAVVPLYILHRQYLI